MTTYHYSRVDNAKPFAFGAYFKFFICAFLFFIVDAYNIPQFFGGNYHLFLFEIGLFFLLFIKKFKNCFFTIFIFYGFIDLLQLNYIGSSFVALLVAFFSTKSFLGIIHPDLNKPLNRLEIFISSVIYIMIFISIKFIIISSILHFHFNSRIFLFFAKSCLYTCFLFLNAFLILGYRKAF